MGFGGRRPLRTTLFGISATILLVAAIVLGGLFTGCDYVMAEFVERREETPGMLMVGVTSAAVLLVLFLVGAVNGLLRLHRQRALRPWPVTPSSHAGCAGRLIFLVAFTLVAIQAAEALVGAGHVESEGWVIWTAIPIGAVLLLLPEFTIVGQKVLGLASRCADRCLRPDNSEAEHPNPGATILRWFATSLVQIVTQPIRVYFHPTWPAVLMTALLHWFVFGTTIWFLERHGAPTVTSFGDESFIENVRLSLFLFAAYLVSHGMEGALPMTWSARLCAILALVLFLVGVAVYGSALARRRERLLQRQLRTKPTVLPMFGHILLAGDGHSVRLLLHQLNDHGLDRDVVVVGEGSSTVAVTGLRSVEHLVWSVDGNLWEQDIREQASVRYADKLIIAGASYDPDFVVRTAIAVEAENETIETVVDLPAEQAKFLRPALTSKLSAENDTVLRWEARRPHVGRDFHAIPHLAGLFRGLLRYRAVEGPGGEPETNASHVRFRCERYRDMSRDAVARRAWKRRIMPVYLAGSPPGRSSTGPRQLLFVE
ncbi:MAG: hypothetical protein KKI08_00575, partial [Armatimonadetes bacterium]|nr:hypothetical protein [Armatimonadota bacterium]